MNILILILYCIVKFYRSVRVKGGREFPFDVTHTIEYDAGKAACGGAQPGENQMFFSTISKYKLKSFIVET